MIRGFCSPSAVQPLKDAEAAVALHFVAFMLLSMALLASVPSAWARVLGQWWLMCHEASRSCNLQELFGCAILHPCCFASVGLVQLLHAKFQ